MPNMQNQTKGKSVFDQFVGKYVLSKTLRFELKPVGKTAGFLKENKVFEKDQAIDDSYNQAKFYFDEVHREFINNSLAKVPSDVMTLLVQSFGKKEKQEKDKKDFSKEWDKARKDFCVKISKIFADEDKKIGNKYTKKSKKNEDGTEDKKASVKFLLSAKVLDYLKEKFPAEKNDEFVNKKRPSLFVRNLATEVNQYIFDSFDKFTTYLGKFQETRNNLYSKDDKATSVASRIIDNFVIFQGNKNKFEDKLKAISNSAKFLDVEKDIFEQDYYAKCFIQGGIDEYNKIVGDLNKKIKEIRDQEETKAKVNRQEFKKGNYPLLIELDKQILSYKDKERELVEKDENFRPVFEDFKNNNEIKFKQGKIFVDNFSKNKFKDECNEVYFQKKVLNTISGKWFVDANAFELLLPQSSGKKEDKNTANIKKYISLADIKSALEKEENQGGLSGDVFKDKYYDGKNGLNLKRGEPELKRFEQFLSIWKFEFENLFKDKKLSNGEILKGYDLCFKKTKEINWENLFNKDKKEESYKKEVEKIKQYADASLGIYQMLKYFVLGGKDAPLGSDLFYGEFNDFYKDFEFIRYYNALRNYITKKSFNPEKVKLNFDNGQLLGGWDKNKEHDYMGVLLKDGEGVFLGIINKTNRNIFDNIPATSKKDKYYRKMVYKQIADATKDVPGLLLSRASGESLKKFSPSQEIRRIKESESFKKTSPNFNLSDLHALIDYYKSCIPKYENWSCYSFNFKSTKEYKNINEFTDDVQRSGYKIGFDDVPGSYIDKLANNGKLYLFEISNKDLQNTKSGKKNIHTLYFEQILSDTNISSPVIKLNGEAEIFRRVLSVDEKEKIITKKNKKIINKGEKAFKLNRYTDDKLFLHLPITINLNKDKINQFQFNKQTNKELSGNKDINIIGVDRGEKNLLHYSVINQKGEILEQGSLNEINGVNYFDKLNQREKERIEARQSWNQVEQIKDLKRGYLSCVIHKICTLIDKYEAIVVLEDLNMRFKQIRGSIEKSVYQQFEKALIDKLGYVVFKDRKSEELGGALRGYQLAAPFESFEKMYKQTGILFYTQADYTSITDPITGFRKNIYIGNSWSQEKIRKAIYTFKSIKWDDKLGGYAFVYNPADFVSESKFKNKIAKHKPQEVFSKEWTACSKVSRIERFRNDSGYWEYNPIDLNRKFEELFKLWDFDEKGNILEQIREKENKKQLNESRVIDNKKRDFYHRFVYLFNLVLQLRNSFSKKFVKDEKGNIKEVGDDIDFIASPVYPFFSMEAKSKEKGILSKLNLAGFDRLIKSANKDKVIKDLDGDANGAYNIARKGIIILDRIAKNPEKPELYIFKNNWDEATAKWAKENGIE